MTCNILSNIAGICQRLKKPQVFHCYREPGIAVTLLRWLTLFVYGWLGAVVVHLLWPWLSYLRPERLFSLADNPGLYGLLQITWSLVAVLLVLTLQDKFFIRFPRKRQSVYRIDIQTFVRYPTLHVSVATGILMFLSAFDGVSAVDGSSLLVISSVILHFPVSVTDQDVSPLVGLDADGLVIFFWIYAFILAVRTEYQIRKEFVETPQSESIETLDLLSCSDDQFRNWLLKEEDIRTLDFFKRKPYVTRMLKRIKRSSSSAAPQEGGQQKSKGQVLLGKFGSGKTTIVNLLEKELDPEWIVSRFDCWQRSGKPEELAAQLMEQIIHDVGQQFEAVSLVGLPGSFAGALYGSSHWWQLLDIWLRPDTPEQVIGKLDTLLKVNNRRLLLVIENVDRNEEREHFVNIVAAILDKLQQSKNLNHIDFIFSADEARLDKELLYRIADYRERVATFISPELLIRFMALCLEGALNRQKNGESLIIPYLSKDFLLPADTQGKISAVRNALALRTDNEESKPSMYSEESIENQVLMALTGILSNPRRLKHVLRNMYQLWMDELKGEVNLFDLLLYVAANDEGSIREGMKKFTPDILEGSGDGPFTANYKRMLREASGEDTNDIPSYDDADFIAFYLLNGDLGYGQPCRTILCQPVIDRGGLSEDVFEKYRKTVDTGTGKGYASSDQEFLKNYLKASAENGDQQALKACLNFALSSSHNLVIFENLLDTMTRKYFSSVTELYDFTYHAIVLADSRYAGTMNGVLNSLIQLCFSVINFDTSGGESHADKLQEKLSVALKNLSANKQYSYLLRILNFVARSGENNLCSQVINRVTESIFTRELSNSIAKGFKEDDAGTYELQYEYISLLPALEKAQRIIRNEILDEACHSFLIAIGEKLEADPQILASFNQKYPDRLSLITSIIRSQVEIGTLAGGELKAWQELLRVLPDSKNTDDSQPQDQ